MEITAPDSQFCSLLPDDFLTLHRISFNERAFIFYRASLPAGAPSQKTITVQFPWLDITENAFSDIDLQFQTLINTALVCFKELQNSLIQHEPVVDFCLFMMQTNPSCCTFSISTGHEQALFKALHDMPCPDCFGYPRIQNTTISPQQSLAAINPLE